MKTTIDIPRSELLDAIRFTGAKTKREAVVAAIADFNQRRRIATLAKFAGTCPDLMTADDLREQRRRRKSLIYTESKLLAGLTPETVHADELARLTEREFGD